MIKKLKTTKGFTLAELIVYVAIGAVVLVSAVSVAWNILIDQGISQNKREVYMNARTVIHQLQQQIKKADDITTGSCTFDSHPGILTLDFPGGSTDVIFDTYTKDVTVGQQTTTIRKLRIKEGAGDYIDLTSDKVNVTDFVLTNFTRGSEAKNININLTLESTNPDNDPNYAASISLETAVTIRR